MEIPRLKTYSKAFIIYRTFNILSDKDICKKIILDIDDDNNKDLLDELRGSIADSNEVLTYEDAINYLQKNVMYTPLNMDKEKGDKKKLEFTLDVLNNDLFPHCKTKEQKIYYLGYMTNKLLKFALGKIKTDDRDSYVNKRIDLCGPLLNNLFRNYFNKVVKYC